MKTEKIFAGIFILGIILKFFHIVGGSILTVSSGLLIAICYFPFGFYFFCGKKINQKNVIFSIISGLLLSIVPIGILFKVQYWNGGKIYLLIGIITTPIIFFLSYYLKNREKGELVSYYNNMVNRAMILTILSVLFYLTPIKW